MVVNHISFLDGALLMAALERDPGVRDQHRHGEPLVAAAVPQGRQPLPARPHQPDGDQGADRQDQCRPALRDLPRGPAQRHRRLDEDLCRPGLHRRPDRRDHPAGAPRRARADAVQPAASRARSSATGSPRSSITFCPPHPARRRSRPARQGAPPGRQPAALRHHVGHGVQHRRLGRRPCSRRSCARAGRHGWRYPGARGHQRRRTSTT